MLQRQIETDRSPENTTSLDYQHLNFDPLTREATLAGKPVELTRIEFDLLHLLLRHPGRAFSRQYLLDSVWGDEVVITDRSVDNVVLKLRKKLGDLGEAIETVWSVGYRLRRLP